MPRSRTSEQWLQVIAELPDADSTAADVSSGAAEKENVKRNVAAPKKRPSKRSLMSDISNLAGEVEGEGPSAKKPALEPAKAKAVKPKAAKTSKKSVPSNQKSIMSFFKAK